MDGKWDGGETVAIRVKGGAVKKYKITSKSGTLEPYTISKGTNFLQVTTSVGTYKASAPSAITLEKRTIYKSKQLTGLPDGSTDGVPKGWVTEDYYD